MADWQQWQEERIDLLKKKIERREFLQKAGALTAGTVLGVGSANAFPLNGSRPLAPGGKLYWFEAIFVTTHRVNLSLAYDPAGIGGTEQGRWQKKATAKGETTAAMAWLDLRGADASKTFIVIDVFDNLLDSSILDHFTYGYGTGVLTGRAGQSLVLIPNEAEGEYVWKLRVNEVVEVIFIFTEYNSKYGAAPTFTVNDKRLLRLNNPVTITDPGAFLPSRRLLAPDTLFSNPYIATDASASIRSYNDSGNNLSYSNALAIPATETSGPNQPTGKALYPSMLNFFRNPIGITLLQHRANKHFLKKFVVANTVAFSSGDARTRLQIGEALGNEMWRTLGGDDVLGRLDSVATSVADAVLRASNQGSTAFQTWCTNTAKKLTTTSTTKVRDLQNYVNNNGPSTVGNWNVGVLCTSNIQLKMDTVNPLFFDLPTKQGIRLSFGLLRTGKLRGQSSTIKTANEYWVLDNSSTGGFKFAITLILGAPIITKKYGLPFTFDLEVTISFTIRNNVWRVDSIAIDPVFDFDTTNFWSQVYAQVLTLLYGAPVAPSVGDAAGIELTQMTNVLQGFGNGVPNGLSTPGGSISSGASNYFSANSVSSSGSTSFFSAVDDLGSVSLGDISLSSIATEAANTAKLGFGFREYKTLEFSPFRIVLPNSDINNATQAFRGGFHQASNGSDRRAWVPGVKYITGLGIAGSYTSSPVLGASFFLRGTLVPEFYFPFCSDACLNNLAYSGAGGGG